MTKRLLTPDYDFFVKNNNFYVKYLRKSKDIILSDVQHEIIGITKTGLDNPWSVTVVTPAAIQKLKEGITETLEVIGFQFNTLGKALEAHQFITYWMYHLQELGGNGD